MTRQDSFVEYTLELLEPLGPVEAAQRAAAKKKPAKKKAAAKRTSRTRPS